MKRLLLTFITLSMFLSILPINTVHADPLISDNTELLGVINAIIVFNATSTDATTYINVSTDSTPDTSPDITTYTDPTDLTNGDYYGSGSIQRYMIIRGLSPSTTYNYTINLNGTSDASGTFTTLPRYTNETGIGDEFIDTELIQSYSGLSLVQTEIDEYGLSAIEQPVAQTDNEQIAIVFQDGKYHYWVASCYNTGQRVYYNYTTDYIDFSQGKDYIEPNIYAGEFGVTWDPENDNWIAISQRINTGPSYKERVYSFPPGNETNVEYVNLSQDPGYEPTFVCYDPLGANNFIFTSIFHSSGRYGTMQYCIPNGTDYSKWIMPSVTTAHRTWTTGIGIKESGALPCYYNHWFTTRNQMYIGFLNTLDADTSVATDKEVYLIYSRDGYDWHVFDNTSAIIPSTGTGWHGNYTTFGGFIEADDSGETYDLLYFLGSESHHEVSPPQNVGLGVKLFRPYGLTYVKPNVTSGYLLTTSISPWYSENFTVNGNFSATDTLNISIHYTNGTVIPGFDITDFDTITTNSTTLSPTWGERTLDDIPWVDFCINFSLSGSDGQLFSYSLDGFGDEPEPNNNPNVTAAYPTNGSTNLTLSITYLSINLTDPDGDLMNYTYMYFTESCTTTGSNTSGLTNGTYNIPITCTLTRNTTYHWWINVTDSNGGYDNETFLFTTKSNHTTSIRITATGTGISDYSYGAGGVFVLLGFIITITIILAIVVYLKQYM